MSDPGASPLVLLLGGTSESAPLAEAVAAAGFRTLVSTATAESLEVGKHPAIQRRVGRLDREGLLALLHQRQVAAMIDAAHPYAVELHANATAAAADAGIPCLRYERPAGEWNAEDVTLVSDHEQAALAAFALGRPVLLTTGSRTLAPYVRKASQTGLPLFVRVLPGEESLAACHAAGLLASQIIAARGPFTLEENIAHLRQTGAGVLVTKDSGEAGGVPSKLAAARALGCRVVVLQRPAGSCSPAATDPAALVRQLREALTRAQSTAPRT